MAKPNYAFAKRQRDLAKKQKKEEKRLRKAGQATETSGDAAAEQVDQDPDRVAGQDPGDESGGAGEEGAVSDSSRGPG